MVRFNLTFRWKNRCLLHKSFLVKTRGQAVLADIKLRGYEIISSLRARNKKGEGVAFLCKNDFK